MADLGPARRSARGSWWQVTISVILMPFGVDLFVRNKMLPLLQIQPHPVTVGADSNAFGRTSTTEHVFTVPPLCSVFEPAPWVCTGGSSLRVPLTPHWSGSSESCSARRSGGGVEAPASLLVWAPVVSKCPFRGGSPETGSRAPEARPELRPSCWATRGPGGRAP